MMNRTLSKRNVTTVWKHWWTAFLWTSLLSSARQTSAQAPGEGLPEPLLREVRSPQNLLRGRYREVKAWEAEGKEAGHSTGKEVSDPEAKEGRAWEAKGYSETPSAHLLFGPYVELERGDYVAFFRMKLLEEADEETVAEIDACVSFGQTVLGVQDVAGTDLTLNRYTQVPLPFQYTSGKLECRVFWPGYTSLRVDRVTVFRLEGGTAAAAANRAPQPVPSGLPRDLEYRSEPRPYPDVFPRSAPPAPRLTLFDLRRQPPDWQLLLLSLQGIVNRTRPEVYCLFNPTDEQWLDWMRHRKWITSTQVVSDPQELINQFRASLKGMVITDPKLPATKNVATMMAGVQEGVVVSPRLSKQVSLPVIADLRGKWTTSVEAYRWAFDNLWSHLNHHLVACSWPEHLGLRDYLVQHKVFIFWLSGPLDGARKYASPDAEVRLMEQLFARMPANIPVMSYPWAGKDVGIGEGPGVTLFAEFAKYLVGSVNCSNLSVHSGFNLQPFHQRAPSPPRLLKDKVYVSVIVSDGDNLPVLTAFNFPQLWKDKVRGQFPIGWTISPSAYLLIPDIVDYYYTTATPQDYFLGAVSGVGYTYPDVYGQRFRERDRTRVFDDFLDQTGLYMAKLDLRAAWIMGVTRPELIRRYAERIPSLQAIFPDYGRRASGYDEVTYPTARNVPVFHAVTGWKEGASREEQVAGLVSEVRTITPAERPAFLHLFVWNWGADLPMLQEVLRRLGPGYVATRPDHLAALYGQEMADRQVLLRTSPLIAGIEGQPVEFSASLQNVSAQPLKVQVRVTTGVKDASVKPDQVKLRPGEAVSLTISGLPAADQVCLDVKGSFGTRSARIALRQIASQELAAPLPPGASLRFSRQFEAEHLSHRSGKEEKDPLASGQTVWLVRSGEAEPGYVVYGPYSPLKAGRYVGLFRLKQLSTATGIVATLDTCVGGGQPVSALREVRGEELPEGEYRSFPLVFAHPGGQLETRVVWSGEGSLAVDSVTLWEIAGATDAATRRQQPPAR